MFPKLQLVSELAGGRALHARIVILGLVALTAPGVILLSSPDAYARGSGSPVTDSPAAGPGLAGDKANGDESTNTPVIAAFRSLSQPQQARVMQRCKDVIAAPAKAGAKQIALCQTLSAAANH